MASRVVTFITLFIVPVAVVTYILITGTSYNSELLMKYTCQAPYVSQWLSKCHESSSSDSTTAQAIDITNYNTDSVPKYSELDVYNQCMLENKEEEQERRNGLKQHGFNEFVSEKIGLIRDVPDVRLSACQDKVYNGSLPKASIVMCFYNEAWSTLLRSVHSILRQSPAELLQEIILLDDSSSLVHLGDMLDSYIRDNFKNVKLVRSKSRLGLIRARIEAAKHATGKVLVFLDSHIEAGKAWLEPLLHRISQDRKTVVVPIVDTIESETMIYRGADLVRGGFTWSLLHNWEPLPDAVRKKVMVTADPFITPTMPGGLFAMDRDYFYELGEYDAGMDIWGGENMEMSFRIWQCGGKLEIVPCSHVGHVFRQFRPYSSPTGEDTATKNAARVADVWLDEYKKHFYDLRPGAKTMDYGDLSDRHKLRQELKCQSFKWFLENIHPEQIVPGEKPKVPGGQQRPKEKKKEVVVTEGMLHHKTSNLCVRPKTDAAIKGSLLVLSECDKTRHKFVLTDIYQVRLADTGLCLETSEDVRGLTTVYLMKCHSSGGSQTWLVKHAQKHNLTLFNPASGKCLSVSALSQDNNELTMDYCSSKYVQDFQVIS